MQQKRSNINKKEFILHIFESKASSSLLEVTVVVVHLHCPASMDGGEGGASSTSVASEEAAAILTIFSRGTSFNIIRQL